MLKIHVYHTLSYVKLFHIFAKFYYLYFSYLSDIEIKNIAIFMETLCTLYRIVGDIKFLNIYKNYTAQHGVQYQSIYYFSYITLQRGDYN